MSDDRVRAKKELRAMIRERRRNMTTAERNTATAAITQHLMDVVASHNAKKISCYLSTPTEPETRPFIEWALAHDVEVLLPISREDGLMDWVVAHTPLEEAPGLFGIAETSGEVLGPIAINSVDLIFVPASAVDKTGMRMGWGRGYFDKSLGSMDHSPAVYAVIFDNELLDEVPREVHDQPVTGVVTPSGVITF